MLDKLVLAGQAIAYLSDTVLCASSVSAPSPRHPQADIEASKCSPSLSSHVDASQGAVYVKVCSLLGRAWLCSTLLR